MPRLLIFHPDARSYAAELRARLPADLSHIDVVATPDEAELRREMPGAEIVVAHQFPLDTLPAAARLRWIQLTTAGAEFLSPAQQSIRHLAVTNARGIHAAPMADYVMAAMTMLHSDFAGMLRDQAAKRWRRRPVAALERRTLGMIGMGAIGQEIARRAAMSGMQVLGLRRSGAPLPHVERMYTQEALHDLLPHCDFVALALPATGDTRAMIGRRELDAMKPGAYIINVGRGAAIDEAALVDALSRRTIAGACLDVFAVEPLPEASPLWTMPNVIVTPHISGMRSDYVERFTDIMIDNLQRFDRGETLRNVVDFERGY